MLKPLLLGLALCASSAFAETHQQQPVYVQHEGNSTGEVKAINGVNIYHAYAPSKSNDNAILFLTDVFGLALAQNRLLADSYARAGYLVLLPDYFKGDPLPSNMPAGFDMTAWRGRHPEAEVTAMIDTTVKYARETLKVKRLGAAGFCFGGPYVVRSLAKGVDVGFIAHPGAFTDAELKAAAGPLTIAAAETDNSLNATRRHQIEDILAKKNATYQINLYSGVSHGFAIRVDMANKQQVFGKESAFWQAVRWFDQWVKGGVKAGPGPKYYAANGQSEGYQRSGNDLRVAHDFEWSKGGR